MRQLCQARNLRKQRRCRNQAWYPLGEHLLCGYHEARVKKLGIPGSGIELLTEKQWTERLRKQGLALRAEDV